MTLNVLISTCLWVCVKLEHLSFEASSGIVAISVPRRGTPPDCRVRQMAGCKQLATIVAATSGTGRGKSEERPACQHSQTALHFVSDDGVCLCG